MTTAWHQFWFAPTDPKRLGQCRAVFFAAFYGLYLAQTDLRQYALFPESFFQPRGLFAWLSLPLPSWDIMGWLVLAFEIAVLCAAAGALTRLATSLSFALGLYLIGLQFNYGYLHWAHAMAPLTMGVLALAPCGDAWALDAIIRQRLSGCPAAAGGQYRWPIQLIRVLFVTVFFAAGLAKLRTAGLTWVLSDTLRHYLMENQYVFQADADTAWSRPLADWLIRHPLWCRIGAGGALLLELSAPAALFSVRARRWIIPACFLFQVANALLLYQNFLFIYLGLYVFWMRWPRAAHEPVRRGS
jgi:hypothetical protein